mgnify:CR=1 FL=1
MATYQTAHNNAATGVSVGPFVSLEDTFYITLMKGGVDIEDTVTGEKVFSIESPFDARRGAKGFTFGTGFSFNIVSKQDGTSCGVAI